MRMNLDSLSNMAASLLSFFGVLGAYTMSMSVILLDKTVIQGISALQLDHIDPEGLWM